MPVESKAPRLTVECNPERVWLFGSPAWGVPGNGSDPDLMVVVGESDEGPTRRAQSAHPCLQGLEVAKDVIVKTRAEVERFRNVRASLVAEILERGRLLYGW